MARVRDGDTQILGQLFARHGERLFRYCWRINQDRQLSEDLVQEAFFRMLRFRTSFRDGHRFESWMYSIVRNLQMDHWRKRRFEGEWDESVELAAASGGDARERLESLEDNALLTEALRRLSPAKREILVLARFEEMPHEQIGQILGCDAGAARVRLHRALASLRETYQALLERRSAP